MIDAPATDSRSVTLGRHYAHSVAVVVTVLVLTVAISIGAVVWASMAVKRNTDSITALRVANQAVLQDMTDAETSLRGFGITYDRADLQLYELGMNYLPQDQARLRGLSRDYPGLYTVVLNQEREIDRWLIDHAIPILEGAEVSDQREERRFQNGSVLFDRIREANGEVDDEIQTVVAELQQSSRSVLAAMVAAVLVIAVLGIVAIGFLARRLRRSVVAPLTDVAEVLERLRSGETDARAVATGPAEVRQIAEELNLLAAERIRAEQVEADVHARLETIDKVRNDLVSTVSHELRTPLTSIAGYLELLLDDIGDDLTPEQCAMVATMERNLARLRELINNLLTLSRAEETRLRIEPLDLRSVASDVASDIRLHAAARDISVHTLLASAPLVVLGDRGQLTRALTNLAINAVKFSEAGDRVEIRVARDGAEAVLEVSDQGIGIPASDLPELGSRFFRASNAVRAEIGGTGLGLRIVQAIVDRHGGVLAVESVEGEGSTFTLRIPAERDPLEPEHVDAVEAAGSADVLA